MTVPPIRPFVRKFLEGALDRYRKDLAAIPEEKFAGCPGGAARSAADFTVECTSINLHMAGLLRGETPAPLPRGEWTRATPELQEKTLCLQEFETAASQLIDAFDALAEEDLGKPVGGQFSSMSHIELAHFAAVHINYHDGQLNYIQAFLGDDAIHWW